MSAIEKVKGIDGRHRHFFFKQMLYQSSQVAIPALVKLLRLWLPKKHIKSSNIQALVRCIFVTFTFSVNYAQ